MIAPTSQRRVAVSTPSDRFRSVSVGGRNRTPLTMLIPPAVLVACAAAIALIPQLGPAVQAAAIRFQDQAGYNATVLAGAHILHPVALAAAEPTGITLSGVMTGTGSRSGR
jgi:hypothetical protein